VAAAGAMRLIIEPASSCSVGFSRSRARAHMTSSAATERPALMLELIQWKVTFFFPDVREQQSVARGSFLSFRRNIVVYKLLLRPSALALSPSTLCGWWESFASSD